MNIREFWTFQMLWPFFSRNCCFTGLTLTIKQFKQVCVITNNNVENGSYVLVVYGEVSPGKAATPVF